MDEASFSYQVTHKTHYEYTVESSLCHNQMHLQPRMLLEQRVSQSLIEIHPRPACRFQWLDTFGNHVEFFSIEELHESLTVTSKSLIERRSIALPNHSGVLWPQLELWMANSQDPAALAAKEFLYDSRYCQSGGDFLQYALGIVDRQFDIIEASLRLSSAIYDEFQYLPESTHVTTQPLDVLAKRRGVCQDFAHVLICCLRSLGIPARYVSGYLLTQPPPGKPKLVGADASHAWVSAFTGPTGWLDLDPTNNVVPGLEHITVAWGRDYADVAPIQGVYVGGGFTSLNVSVDVSLANDSTID